jgi:hypothetical protein
VAEYARTNGSYSNQIQEIFSECQSHCARLFGLYSRVLGRLVLIAEKVEAHRLRSVDEQLVSE